MIEKSFVILNELGLHARAATRLVQTANRFRSEITVEKEGVQTSAKSVMGVLFLVASKGNTIKIRADGEDEVQAMEALERQILSKFGEG